jgi:hypothetical protein
VLRCPGATSLTDPSGCLPSTRRSVRSAPDLSPRRPRASQFGAFLWPSRDRRSSVFHWRSDARCCSGAPAPSPPIERNDPGRSDRACTIPRKDQGLNGCKTSIGTGSWPPGRDLGQRAQICDSSPVHPPEGTVFGGFMGMGDSQGRIRRMRLSSRAGLSAPKCQAPKSTACSWVSARTTPFATRRHFVNAARP